MKHSQHLQNRRANHAAHFLSRIDRLNTQHAEIALGLYRDHELVKILLAHAKLPGDAERIALALDDDKTGPFIVVTRGGKFVTCLAKGMKIPESQPVISRHALDHLSEKVAGLRELFQKAASGREHQSDQLLKRVLHAGSGLSQEEFDDLVVWTPYLASTYFKTLVNVAEILHKHYCMLRVAKGIGKRNEPLLKAFWELSWASSHLTALVASDPSVLARALDICDRELGPSTARRVGFVEAQVESDVLPFAMRGVWLAAKLPKLFLSSLKTEYLETMVPTRLLSSGLSLAATGLRHRRYQAEVQKTLDRSGSRSDPTITRAARSLSKVFTGSFRIGLEGEAEELLTKMADEQMSLYAKELCETPEQVRFVEEMPRQAKLAGLFNLPRSLSSSHEALLSAILWLPEVARANPRDFYVPASYQHLFMPGYRREDATMLLRWRMGLDRFAKPAPLVAEKKPSRNDACPCNSGKKYKRCCGAV